MKRYNEDNDMHNEKWTCAEWLHAEFIIASQNSRKSSRQPSSLSVTTQRTKMYQNESCKHLAKYKATTHMDPLEDYQLICFSPFCQEGPKRFEDIEHLLVPMRSRWSSRVGGGIWRCWRAWSRDEACWRRWRWSSIVFILDHSGSHSCSRGRELRVFKRWSSSQHSPSRRCGVKLVSLSVAILLKIIFRTHQR